jgi:hypothetical protein
MTAIARLDQMMPVMTSTLSDWISLSASCTARSGLRCVVLDDQFDVVVAGLLERQLEAVAHIDAERGAAARKRGDHADLDRLCKCHRYTGEQRARLQPPDS